MGTLASPSLTKLITNVRNFLNQPNPDNSLWTNLELTEYVNEAIRLCYNEIIANGEGQFTSVSTLDITANVETVALPSDFFEVRALYIQRNNAWEILQYRNDITNGFFTNSGTSGNTYLPFYFLRDQNLVLRPTPNFTQSAALRLEYIRFPETLINGGDQLTSGISPIFKQVIEMYAVYKAKLKESLVNGVQMHLVAKQNLDELFVQFREIVNKRSKYPEFTVPFSPESTF